MKKTLASVTRSSGNIFADLGLPDADDHMLRARVAIFIGNRIKQLHLTQQAAAKRMGISQPDVSNLLRGRLEGFSLTRLLSLVRALGNDVEIKVKRAPAVDDKHRHEGRLSLMMA